MYTRESRGKCQIMFLPTFSWSGGDGIYADLGVPFLTAFYSEFDFLNDRVYFAVNIRFATQAQAHKFPGLLIPYLGLTCIVFPPVISALCMEYHYCPRRRRNQRIKRVKKLNKQLHNQEWLLYNKASCKRTVVGLVNADDYDFDK